ncbi:unnamed protein product [Rotaria socialis]|uniref:Uncharacterized protein n=1 Tax=Rotaria socialis TaxID=392032 RepID=A0A817UX23_9BILA|nr:unnamed protein product [Rotaria socialis]CAF4535281.1 unnamed protein product [Rotaria socialis]
MIMPKNYEQQEEKQIESQSSNDVSNNQPTKMAPMTTDNDDENYPSVIRLKRIVASNADRSEEKTDDIISDEELNGNILLSLTEKRF